MKTTPRKGKAAFTLIELMAVITIIVILAGLVVGGLGFVSERQAKEKAKVQMALLSKALEEYKLDMGTYPLSGNSTTGTGNSLNLLYLPLFYEGWDYDKQGSPASWTKKVGTVDVPKSTKIYLSDLDPRATKQGWVDVQTAGDPKSNLQIKDPWGKEYAYRTAMPPSGTTPNAATQNPDFDLWSYGKDGKTNADPKHKDSLDDIKNF